MDDDVDSRTKMLRNGATGDGQVNHIPVRLQNRVISAGLEPVLSLTEKSCIVLYPVLYEYKNVQS